MSANHNVTELLSTVVDHLDIPQSYYEKATSRHQSLGEWLHREESRVAVFDPDVRPQGSFRFGTVNRPVRKDEVYDLDNICVLKSLGKTSLTQKQLKELFGTEIKAYAVAHDMLAPVEERNRCWRLPYADEAPFHLDTLPCVPEERHVIQRIIASGVDPFLANCAVAITDRRHPQYTQVTSALFSSNPRGFARWFEQRAALGRARKQSEGRVKAVIEDVPPYEWKTPLQRVVQILKRHRDVMFFDDPDLAPISMIITNLAARAYEGESDLWLAFSNIVEKMFDFVRPTRPWIPNPTDPAEDYADKWAKDPRLEKNFWLWQAELTALLKKVPGLLRSGNLHGQVDRIFQVSLTQDEIRLFESRPTVVVPAAARSTPPLIIPSAPRPWGGK